MPADHFVVDFANHVRHGEAPLFPRDLRMKDNLQKQVAHLFRKLGVVPAFEGFQNFVSFFEQIGSQRLMRLLAIPGTTVANRSEEHTSELQSLAYLVCRLLLEKKNKDK